MSVSKSFPYVLVKKKKKNKTTKGKEGFQGKLVVLVEGFAR